MTVQDLTIVDALQHQLLNARRRDGAWGYEAGRPARLEPTCWALLALGTSRPESARVLAQWPSHAGALVEQSGGLVNWSFHALALWTLLALGEDSVYELDPIAAALVEARGIALTPSSAQQQNSHLQGWSWIDGTFSWVEPTAWCVLALKKWMRAHDDRATAARVAEGERLLIDRVCRNGGWNYGNSNMLGTELQPYVPTTALALLSLRDVGEPPHVVQGLRYLEAHQQTETGALALSLACICLAVCDRPHAVAREALTTEWRHARFLDNLHVTALALYAATAEQHQYGAFRV